MISLQWEAAMTAAPPATAPPKRTKTDARKPFSTLSRDEERRYALAYARREKPFLPVRTSSCYVTVFSALDSDSLASHWILQTASRGGWLDKDGELNWKTDVSQVLVTGNVGDTYFVSTEQGDALLPP